MKYQEHLHSHRFALSIVETEDEIKPLWNEIKTAIENITDQDIIDNYLNRPNRGKSISASINQLLKEQFINMGWFAESPIFNDASYNQNENWRLDYAKEDVSVEVAFNHSGVIAWNLLKPVLASELNHVEKAIQTRVGVIICATDDLRRAGGFDSAVGTYEKFLKHLPPLNNQLSVPLVIIGLEAPETFEIVHQRKTGSTSKIGYVVMLETGEILPTI